MYRRIVICSDRRPESEIRCQNTGPFGKRIDGCCDAAGKNSIGRNKLITALIKYILNDGLLNGIDRNALQDEKHNCEEEGQLRLEAFKHLIDSLFEVASASATPIVLKSDFEVYCLSRRHGLGRPSCRTP